MSFTYIVICISISIVIGRTSFAQATRNADSLLAKGNYQEAIKEYSMIISSDTNFISVIDRGNAYLRRGRSYFLMDNVDICIQDYFKALSIFRSINNLERLSATYTNISSAYSQKLDYETADKYWNYAYESSKELNDSLRLLNLLSDKGIILFKSGKYNEAVILFSTCINDYSNVLDVTSYIQLYTNLGNSYEVLNADSALFYYRMAEDLAQKKGDTTSLSIILSNIGYIFLKKNLPKIALIYLQRGYKLSQNQDDMVREVNMLYNLSVAFDSLNIYDSALNYLRKAMELNDSIFNIEKSKYASELSEKYESDKKDEKIRTQETENKLKTRNLLLSLGGLALAAALAIISFISYKRKQRANKILQEQKEKIETLNKDLDASNQVKTKLFSVISHDLRSPISSLYAYLQLKTKTTGKNDNVIIEQTEQLLETLEDLLVWSKSQLHQFVPIEQPVWLYDLCNQIMSLTESFTRERLVNITNKIHPDLSISSDPNMLTIILRNLISNGVKYARPHTAIIIAAERRNIDISVSVSNETDMENASLLSTAAEPTVTSSKSGLGITLVKEFVSKLKGNFSYTVNQNKVTTTITLPV